MNAPPDPAILSQVSQGLARLAGFRFNPAQPTALWSAIVRRTSALRLRDPQTYFIHLLGEDEEWMRLAEEVTIHETTFFRHTGQFRALSEVVLPELVRRRTRERELRLWSAACATGEEAYSLAIAAHRLNLGPGWKVKVLATDLSTKALAAARLGVFDKRRLSQLPEGFSEFYFEKAGNQFRIRSEILPTVEFQPFNLTQEEPLPFVYRAMDVVFCENVLIYFSPEASRRTVALLRQALGADGYLFLGFSETLHGMSEGFVPVLLDDTYIYRRVLETPPRPAADREKVAPRSARSAPSPSIRPARPAQQVAPQAAKPRIEPRSRASPASWMTGTPAPASDAGSIDSAIAAGQLGRGLGMARDWLAREPDSNAARFALARLLAALDRGSEATEHLRRVLAADSLHVESYVLLGVVCYRQGELGEAAQLFHHALYLQPLLPLAYFFLGNIYQQQRQIGGAVHAYRNALRAMPQFMPSWDSGFTRELLVQVCEQNIKRLGK